MEQSDLDLLQTVPLYHMQTVARVRRLPQVTQTLSSEVLTNVTAPLSATSALSIAPYLYDNRSLLELLPLLGKDETHVLREIVACGGRANSRDLALYFQRREGSATDTNEGRHLPHTSTEGEVHQDELQNSGQAQDFLTFAQYPTAHPHGPFELAIHQLLALGLLYWGKQTRFSGRDYTSGVHDGVLIVPQSVMHAVHRVWPLKGKAELEEGAVQIMAPDERIQRFQRTLYMYWSFVSSARDGLALMNNGFLARTALRQLCEQLAFEGSAEQIRLESDAPRLLFMRLLLQQLGLLVVQKNVLTARPAQDFFSQPLLERARLCYCAYKESSFWNELAYLPAINVRPVPDPLLPAHTELVRARSQVLDRLAADMLEQSALASVEGEDALDTPASFDLLTFIAHTKLHIPSLLFPRQYGPRAERYSQECNPYGYDFRLRRGWLTHREGWHMVEGGFIRAVIAEPLSWLGLIYPEQSSISLFSFPAEAVAFLHDQPVESTTPTQGRLLVQPNFEIVALAPVAEGELLMLDSFAERMRLELIAQYRLTKASVMRAIQRGLDSEKILAYLEETAGAEVPQNVRYSLAEWERQARRIEIWSATSLIEVADEELLNTLMTDETLRHIFQRRLTPTIAEVYTQRLPLLQEMLWRRSLLPALSPVPDQDVIHLAADEVLPAHDPQWRLHTNGLLEPVCAVLDLYIVTALTHFTIVDSASGWPCITEESVQSGLQYGLTLETITRFLCHYCQDGIPGSFLIRLKLWGGGYKRSTQQVRVERAPLLHLSEEILRDLQADEEVAQLLDSEVRDQQRFVRVSAQHLARILQILQERGFSIDED